MAQAECARLRWLQCDVPVFRQLAAWIERQDEPALQLERRDGSSRVRLIAWTLCADDARGLQPQAVAIEPERPLEVTHREPDNMGTRSHSITLRGRTWASCVRVT